VGEDRRGREQGEGIEHVGGEDIPKAVERSGPGLKVCEGAVASLPIGLDVAIYVEGIYVVEEGAIIQRLWQGSIVAKVATDSKSEATKFSQIGGSE